MTPAAQYAQRRAEAVELIRQHAPPRLQDALIELLRPAIALSATRADDSQIPLGASKFGGAPDVPPNFKWPKWNDKPLGFLAQINLEEVAAFDAEALLPKRGLLSFFYFLATDDWPYGKAEQKDGWRVYYFINEPLAGQAVPPAAFNEYPFAVATFKFETRWTASELPYDCWGTMTEQESDSLGDYRDITWFTQPQHQIFGNPKEVQDDVRVDAAKNSGRGEAQEWLLLLQIDTDDTFDFMWGDSGTLYFLIHKDDLTLQDFSQVWCIADCS